MKLIPGIYTRINVLYLIKMNINHVQQHIVDKVIFSLKILYAKRRAERYRHLPPPISIATCAYLNGAAAPT